MPETLDRPPSAALSTLPGAAMLFSTRRLLIWALGTAFLYTVVSGSSKGFCTGSVTDIGFVGADGQPTDVAPQCLNITQQPSAIVYAVIAIVVLVTITRVLKTAESEAAAIRSLDRAVIVIISVVGAWLVIAQVSFWMIPIAEWDGSSDFVVPFTFGNVDVDISPVPLRG